MTQTIARALETIKLNIESVLKSCAMISLTICAFNTLADDKSDYNQRAAVRDLCLFHALDRNADDRVTRLEARGDVNFLPRFNDMEVDMDGAVTNMELRRYIEQRYKVTQDTTDRIACK